MWKGSLIRELVDLPVFWGKISQNTLPEFTRKKFFFGDNRYQFFLLLKPELPVKKIIVYYHGGGWIFGNPSLFPAYASCFLKKGYAVVLPTYRRLPFVNFREIREDLTLGTQAVFKILEKEKMINFPIILGGMSAGAHCAAHLFYDENELKKIGLSDHPFAGLMLFGAPVDLTKMNRTPVLRRLAGKRYSKLFQYTNPINLLPSNIKKPVLGVHGKKDGLAHFDNGKSFFDKLISDQPELTSFLALENQTHLDSVKWTHSEGNLRSRILDWTERID